MIHAYKRFHALPLCGFLMAVLLTALVPKHANAGPPTAWYWKGVWVPLTDDEDPDKVMSDITTFTVRDGSSSICDSKGILFPEAVLKIENWWPNFPTRDYKYVGIMLGVLEGQTRVQNAKFHTGVYYLPEGVFAPCESLESINIVEDDDRFLPPPPEYTQVYFSTSKGKELYKKREDGNVLHWASCKTKRLDVPEGTVRIGNLAFATCKDMTRVTIPESMDSIGAEAFKSEKLAQIVCNAAIPPVAESSSFANYSAKLYVPAQSIDLYRSTEPWCNFAVIGDATGVDSAVKEEKTINTIGNNISLSGFENGRIEVYDMTGRQVAAGGDRIEPALPHGIYIVRGSDAKTTLVRRVLIH